MASTPTSLEILLAAAALGGVLISGISLFYNGYRERITYMHSLVYREKFKYSRMLYTNLSRLRDAVELAADFQISDTQKINNFKEVIAIADTVRRAIKQDDVLYPERFAQVLDGLLSELRRPIWDFEDSLRTRQSTAFETDQTFSAARKSLLAQIDNTIEITRPYLREQYGTQNTLLQTICDSFRRQRHN